MFSRVASGNAQQSAHHYWKDPGRGLTDQYQQMGRETKNTNSRWCSVVSMFSSEGGADVRLNTLHWHLRVCLVSRWDMLAKTGPCIAHMYAYVTCGCVRFRRVVFHCGFVHCMPRNGTAFWGCGMNKARETSLFVHCKYIRWWSNAHSRIAQCHALRTIGTRHDILVEFRRLRERKPAAEILRWVPQNGELW